MLDFILGETKKEESEAHDEEKRLQHAFEDSMQELTDEEKELKETLANLKETLAESQADLLSKQEESEIG